MAARAKRKNLTDGLSPEVLAQPFNARDLKWGLFPGIVLGLRRLHVETIGEVLSVSVDDLAKARHTMQFQLKDFADFQRSLRIQLMKNQEL